MGLIQRDIHGVAELLHSGGKVGIKCLLRHRHIAEVGDKFHVSLRRRQPFKKGNTRFFPLRGGFCRAHSHAPLHDQFFAAVKHRVGHGGDGHLLRGVVRVSHRVGVIEYTGRGRCGDNGIAGAERFRGVAVLQPYAALQRRVGVRLPCPLKGWAEADAVTLEKILPQRLHPYLKVVDKKALPSIRGIPLR